MKNNNQRKKIVIIGGGTGTHTILKGLKKYPVDLSAIVTMADNGGSTGRLRDEFGFLPVGDVRMALAALAEDEEGLLRDLFLYRFNKGEGLNGHNFGNLFLVALTDILGSEEEAIQYASKILRVRGQVIPVTTDHVNLVATLVDESIVYGETNIDEPIHDGTLAITKLYLEPEAEIATTAKKAIMEADIVVLGPGDLFTSILPNIIVDGVSDVLMSTKAQLVYVANLMTKYGQTYGMSVTDHLNAITKYVGREPDSIIINNNDVSKEMKLKYGIQNEFQVIDDLKSKTCNIIRRDLLAHDEVIKKSGDVLKRSLVRHDSDKLAEVVTSLKI